MGFTPESDIISSFWKRSDAEELYREDVEDYAVYFEDGRKTQYRAAPSGHYDSHELVIGTEGMRNYRPAYGLSWADQLDDDMLDWDYSDLRYMGENGDEPAPSLKETKGKVKKRRNKKKKAPIVPQVGEQDFPGSPQVEHRAPALDSTVPSRLVQVYCDCCSSEDIKECKRWETPPSNPHVVRLSDTLVYHNTSDLLVEEENLPNLRSFRSSRSQWDGSGQWATLAGSESLYSLTPLSGLRKRSNQALEAALERLNVLSEVEYELELPEGSPDLYNAVANADEWTERAFLDLETEIVMLRRLLRASAARLEHMDWMAERRLCPTCRSQNWPASSNWT